MHIGRKNLQKTAKSLSELDVHHPGILDPESFNEHFKLRCYEPCKELRPFVLHIWTQRHRTKQAQRIRLIELPSGPNVYIFISTKDAAIRGVSPTPFDYSSQVSPVVVGVKFRPGGFYAFWKKSMSDLENTTIPISIVFPQADKTFVSHLLKKSDTEIVNALETLLLSQHPIYDNKIDTIDRVLKIVEKSPLTQSVRDVARIFGRSERSLQLLFHQYVGVSLKWVIIRRRFLCTIEQVRSSGSNWTSAAAEAGYSNQSHFTREFKNIIGQSPSEYIKDNQQQFKP